MLSNVKGIASASARPDSPTRRRDRAENSPAATLRRERAENSPAATLRRERAKSSPAATRRGDRAKSSRAATLRGDRGSVLLLFPAAVMVMLVLAAIVLDVGLARVRFQELRAVAASAANDAAGAVDVDSLRSTGAVSFDPAAARARVEEAVAAGPLPAASVDAVEITRSGWGHWEVTVTLSLEVDLIIAPALPGAAGAIDVAVSERVLIV